MDKVKIYQEIESVLSEVFHDGIPWESKLVSLIAVLKDKLSYVSWVGYYRNDLEHLWIGPYQGKLACLHIPPGRGVCGRALQEKKTLIIDDVQLFPNHIACDPYSRSEMVLIVWKDKKVSGVLDLDSHKLKAFDQIDKDWVEKFLGLL